MALQIRLQKQLKYFSLDVTLNCPDGKMLVLIGPSGGGKTTLVRILAGLERPDAGRIVHNQSVWCDTVRGICLPPQKRSIGYVFQEYTLFPHLTLQENVRFAAADRSEADTLLATFGIAHLGRRKPHQVSGGERQRCAICQALARRPEVLLLDEPFSSLDVVNRRSLREELKAVKQTLACPILYVTHDINEALYLADEILPLVEGKIDREWMARTLAWVSPANKPAKAVRQPRLALVY